MCRYCNNQPQFQLEWSFNNIKIHDMIWVLYWKTHPFTSWKYNLLARVSLKQHNTYGVNNVVEKKWQPLWFGYCIRPHWEIEHIDLLITIDYNEECYRISLWIQLISGLGRSTRSVIIANELNVLNCLKADANTQWEMRGDVRFDLIWDVGNTIYPMCLMWRANYSDSEKITIHLIIYTICTTQWRQWS